MRQAPNSTRRAGWRHLIDPDFWHSISVSALAFVATGGLLWLGYAVHAWRLARRAPLQPQRANTLLLFGKRLAAGAIDADYDRRVQRAHRLLLDDPQRRLLLLGGRSSAGPSEAAAALARLQALGLPPTSAIECEDRSTDTLQNLRNARDCLGPAAPLPVALISSRYHLARCRMLAAQLGFDAEVVAAEPAWRSGPASLARIAQEGAYCLWLDVGTRWARLIGHRRMIDRVT